VALQLGNNSPGSAMDYVKLMQNRAKELVDALSDRNSSAANSLVQEPTSDDSSWEMIDVGCSACKEDNPLKADQLINCCNCPRQFHTFCVGLRKIPPFGTKTEQDVLIREKYLKRHFGEWKCPKCVQMKSEPSKNRGSTPDIIGSDLSGNPLSSFSPGVNSGGGVIITDKIGSGTPSLHNYTPDTKNGRHDSSKPSNFRSKQDQIAILVALLASSGISIEELLTMSEERQKEVIMSVISKRHPEYAFEEIHDQRGNLDLVTAMKGIISHNKPTQPFELKPPVDLFNTPSISEGKHPGVYKSDLGEGLSSMDKVKDHHSDKEGTFLSAVPSQPDKTGKKVDPRAAMLENLKRRQLQQPNTTFSSRNAPDKNSEDSKPGNSKLPSLPNTLTFSKSGVDSLKLKDIPEFSSYFAMLKVTFRIVCNLYLSFPVRTGSLNPLLQKRLLLRA
jgi:hypothetical protein